MLEVLVVGNHISLYVYELTVISSLTLRNVLERFHIVRRIMLQQYEIVHIFVL